MDLEELAMLLEVCTPQDDVTPEEFENACEASKRIPKLDDEQKLQLYGILLIVLIPIFSDEIIFQKRSLSTLLCIFNRLIQAKCHW